MPFSSSTAEKLITVEAAPLPPSLWDQFWQWFLSLPQWQQALIVATPIMGIVAYAAIKK